MITTIRATRFSLVKCAIIGLLALLLAVLLGRCTALRLGYNNGPQLTWWWLDVDIDCSNERALAARLAIDRWFEWHRPAQLPEYAAVLASAARGAAVHHARRGLPVAGAGARQDRAGDRPRAGSDGRPAARHGRGPVPPPRTAPGEEPGRVARQVPAPRPGSAAEGLFQGRAGSRRADLWQAERSAPTRHRRRHRGRALQQRLAEFNCGWFARPHNATTPAQRQRARDTLKRWEEDLRSLVGTPPA